MKILEYKTGDTLSWVWNIFALICAIAAQFGYTGEVPKEWVFIIPVAVAIINLIIKWLSKPPA